MSDPLPTVPLAPDFARSIAIFEGLRQQYGPERSAAERAARDVLAAEYPGQYVAYLDEWDGARLTRTVVGAGRSIAAVHAQLRARPDREAIRHTVVVTRIHDPEDDAISVPWFTIESVEREPQEEAGDGGARIPG